MLPAVLTGIVTNASNAAPINGATVAITGGPSATTNASGAYTINNPPTGQRTVQTSASGFTTRMDTVSIAASGTTTFSTSLPPVAVAGNVTIVLGWGAQPPDLDAHLTGPNSAGGRFHVYFQDRNPVPYASLDVDVRTGTGPETITVAPVNGNFVAGSYSYFVNNFSGTPGFERENGTVTIFQGGRQLQQFRTANASGALTLANWSVFSFTLTATGQISISAVQQFTDSAPALMAPNTRK